MSELYLGIPAFEPKPFTRLEPMARHEAGMWRTYNDWSVALPTEGRVFAPHLSGFSKGELLAFSVEPNRRGDDGRDQFLVASPQRVMEVLDLRSFGEEGARRRLVEIGVRALPPRRVSTTPDPAGPSIADERPDHRWRRQVLR